MAVDSTELMVVGKITTVYGIKGWVKVHAFTESMDNFAQFNSYYFDKAANARANSAKKRDWQPIKFESIKRHGKGLIAQIEGVTDREQARLYCQHEVAVSSDEIPAMTGDDFYWHELVGLQVITTNEAGEDLLLGKVTQMMETGANDVLVVKSCKGSIDQRERLLPWLPEQVIKEVDIEAGVMRVEWDAEF